MHNITSSETIKPRAFTSSSLDLPHFERNGLIRASCYMGLESSRHASRWSTTASLCSLILLTAQLSQLRALQTLVLPSSQNRTYRMGTSQQPLTLPLRLAVAYRSFAPINSSSLTTATSSFSMNTSRKRVHLLQPS